MFSIEQKKLLIFDIYDLLNSLKLSFLTFHYISVDIVYRFNKTKEFISN